MLIDLHAHSTASDGTDSPAELMAAAAAAGLDVVAITDHDNTAGWAPALAARPAALTVIRGAEFSTLAADAGVAGRACTCSATCSIPDTRRSSPSRPGCGEERLHRGMAIVAEDGGRRHPDHRGAGDGRSRTARRSAARTSVRPWSRPGVVDSVDQAFASHLAGRGPYYVPKADTDLPTAIAHDRRGRRGQRHRPPARPG